MQPPGRPLKPDSDRAARPPLRRLFLDDDPLRAATFLAEFPDAVWVETAADCAARLAEPWDEVHLDHDLGGEHYVDPDRTDCGMEVVRWLVGAPRSHLRGAKFIVHSHNHVAATLMGLQLALGGFTVEVRPFGAPPPPHEEPPPEEPPDRLGPLAKLRRSLRGWFGPWSSSRESWDRIDPTGPPPDRPDFGWTPPTARTGDPAPPD